MARTQGHGNPPWTRDETILALDLYLECGDHMPSPKDRRVVALSQLLRKLPYHASGERQPSYRNPDGVAFKLQNLRQVATGKGLQNVSAMDRTVWADFGANNRELKQLAQQIRKGINIAMSQNGAVDEKDDDEDEFAEGRILTRLHKIRERASGLRKRVITQRRRGGRLACDLCLDSAKTADATLEDAIFEVHHIVPIALMLERKTRLEDVVLLCASCHRLLHRGIAQQKRWLTLADARRVLHFGVVT